MKVVFIGMLCLALFSCSTTTVHLYSRYLSKNEVDSIQNKLTELGYKVEVNTLAFPDEINQSTLVYSPFVVSEERLNSVINTVAAMGWKLSNSEMLQEGNHWYTKNNVGLYLIDQNIIKHDDFIRKNIANDYIIKGCSITGTLTLNLNGRYQIIFSKGLNETINKRKDFMQGNWKVTYFPYMELKSLKNGWFLYFKVQSTSMGNRINAINLIPENTFLALEKCYFYHEIAM